MSVDATVVQGAPVTTFQVTVRLVDHDAKTIMNKTPNVWFMQGTLKTYLYEMNPVPSSPGLYRITLQTALPRALRENDTLTLDM